MPTDPLDPVPTSPPIGPVTRRSVLATGLATGLALGATAATGVLPSLAAAATPSPRRTDGKTMLILGGTAFLGPAVVRAAQAAGYTVTLFNRGRTNPHLFPDLEKLRGDRDTDDLSALEGRSFDVVVDTSGYVPAHVRRTAELLAEGCRRYVFVSSVSAYSSEGSGVRDESSPVTVLDDATLASVRTIRESFPHYSGMKAHCEKAAEEALPGKTFVVRPGLIVGPEDRSDRFTYWPVRIVRGGEILAPGDPEAPQQFIDVNDLGDWIVRGVEDGLVGAYNAVGFPGTVTMEELLHGMKITLRTDCSFTWIPDAFLLDQEVGPWQELPLWIPSENADLYANAKAIAAGLTFRSIAETIHTTAAWHARERGDDYRWRRTLTAEKEAKVLAAWHARAAAAGSGEAKRQDL